MEALARRERLEHLIVEEVAVPIKYVHMVLKRCKVILH